MKRKAGGEIAEPGYGGAAGGSGPRGSGRASRGRQGGGFGAGPAPAFEITEEDFEPHTVDRESASTRDEDAQGALEIEFEDDGDSAALSSPAGRSRDLRPAALTALAAAVLGAAFWATHGATAPPADSVKTAAALPPNYAAFSVVVAYHNAYIVSTAQRKIDVNLEVSPVQGAKVRIIAYYISENGVTARADPPPSVAPLPVNGMNVRLELTVTNCATVPIGESMGFVDVVADGPAGVIDRFTILGERYSTDLANLLRQVCPGRADGQGPNTIGVVVSGS